MATQTYSDDVEILGSQDEVQLVVRGNTVQSEALQQWQNDAATALAEVTEDGRLRVGGDLAVSAPSALVEANLDLVPSDTIKQGWQSRGSITGALTEAVTWILHELRLLGTGGVSGLYTAMRSHLTHSNSGDSSNAELRAGDFQATNTSGSAPTPVGQLTGVHGAANNDPSAYLSTAIGVEATISNGTGGDITDAAAFEVAAPINTGTIDNLYGLRIPDMTAGGTSNHAIETGLGTVHLGDVLELKAQAETPSETPATDVMSVYPKTDGKLYIKNDSGVEFDLTGGGDNTLAVLGTLIINTYGGFMRNSTGGFVTQ